MARRLLEFFAVLLNHFLFAGCVEVRLVNSLDTCIGRVEVCYNNTWGTVCGELWDISGAALVCKELNCGRAFTAHDWALFGEGSGPSWSVNCAGSESLSGCLYNIVPNNYPHHQYAGVVCSASIVVIIGAVIIAVVFLLSFTIIIILVVRKRRSQKHQISSSDCVQDAVTMNDVVYEDRYEESDEDDYEKVDVDGDREDLNSNSEQDYVNMDEPVPSNVETDDSEQDYVNVETEDSEGDYVNVESEDSEGDYVNVENTEDSTVDSNLDA